MNEQDLAKINNIYSKGFGTLDFYTKYLPKVIKSSNDIDTLLSVAEKANGQGIDCISLLVIIIFQHQTNY